MRAYRLCCCRLPYSTSEKDIVEFFAEYPVSEVAFVYEPDGRPSGLVSGRSSGLVEQAGPGSLRRRGRAVYHLRHVRKLSNPSRDSRPCILSAWLCHPLSWCPFLLQAFAEFATREDALKVGHSSLQNSNVTAACATAWLQPSSTTAAQCSCCVAVLMGSHCWHC